MAFLGDDHYRNGSQNAANCDRRLLAPWFAYGDRAEGSIGLLESLRKLNDSDPYYVPALQALRELPSVAPVQTHRTTITVTMWRHNEKRIWAYARYWECSFEKAAEDLISEGLDKMADELGMDAPDNLEGEQ